MEAEPRPYDVDVAGQTPEREPGQPPPAETCGDEEYSADYKNALHGDVLLRQLVGSASPACPGLARHATRDEFVDVAQRSIRRAFPNRRPFAAGELPFEAIEQAIEQFDLPLVERRSRPALPEACFGQNRIQCALCIVSRSP